MALDVKSGARPSLVAGGGPRRANARGVRRRQRGQGDDVSGRDPEGSSPGGCFLCGCCKAKRRGWHGSGVAVVLAIGCIATVQLPVLLRAHREAISPSSSFLSSADYETSFFLHSLLARTNRSTTAASSRSSSSLEPLDLQLLLRSDRQSPLSPGVVYSLEPLPDERRMATTETAQAATETLAKQKRLPRMYLHVGPYKTGSTFLQCAMSGDLYKVLRSDNVLYLGTCAYECVRRKQQDAAAAAAGPVGVATDPHSVRMKAGPRDPDAYEFCLGHSGDSLFYSRRNHTLREELRQKLRSLRLESPPRDAMIAWEFLSDLRPSKLSSFVRELRHNLDWDVRVVVHYRRLYEWLPSMFDQLHRPGWNGRPHYMVWPGDRILPSFRKLTKAANEKGPEGGGNNISPPREMFGQKRPHFEWPSTCASIGSGGESNRSGRAIGPSGDCQGAFPVESRYKAVLEALEGNRMHPAEQAVRLWLPHATTVTVLDLHQMRTDASPPGGTADGPRPGGGDALLVELFCHVIPGLNRTCAAVLSGMGAEVEEADRNARFDGNNYDWLAVHARERGLYPGGDALLSRTAAGDAVRHHQEVVLCRAPDDFPLACPPLTSLESLRSFSLFLERRILPGRERGHDEGFERHLRERRFCRVDSQETLKRSEWKSFFAAAVAVGPVVLDRDRLGRWYPPFDLMRQSIQEVFYPNAVGRPLRRSAEKIEFVGFISPIGGTGLTKLLALLRESNGSVVHHFHAVNSNLGCVFGPTFGAGARENSSLSSLPLTSSSVCLHTTFLMLVKEWVETLPNLKVPRHLSTEEFSLNQASPQPNVVQALLTPVMMVRDPLDRLIALYAQTGKDGYHEDLSSSLTSEESFASWLQSLSLDPERRKAGQHRDQFRSIATDVVRAIKTISEEPKVLVLIQECAHLSFQLLSERHPTIVSRELINDSMQSLGSDMPSKTEAHRLTLNSEQILQLRNRTRVWFESEYRFYDAAAMQFRRLVSVSKTLESAAIEKCINTLDR